MLTDKSLFNSNELFVINDGLAFLAKHLQKNPMELAIIAILITEGLTEGSISEPFNS